MWHKLIMVTFLFICFFGADRVLAKEPLYFVKTEGVVNLRGEPNTQSLIVYQLKNDMQVQVIRTTGDWSYLSYDGVKGYLLNDYLIEKEEVDTHVTDFFYHTLGYQMITEPIDIEKVSFLSALPITQLIATNQLDKQANVTGKILKTTRVQQLKGRKIVIDPGHGGNEAGASAFGVKEGKETVALGSVLRRHLEREGAEVILTVDENFQQFRRMSLRERASFAKRYDADLFISLHYNINENPYTKGTETYYNRTPFEGERNPYPDESERLANYIQAYLVSSISTKDLGTKDSEYHVLRNNSVPSVLIEVAFLSNKEEVERLQTEEFKEKSAYGITQGVIHYFE